MANQVAIRLIASCKKKIELMQKDYKKCESEEVKTAIVTLIAERDEMIDQLKECI